MDEGEPLSPAQIESALIQLMSGEGRSMYSPSIGSIRHIQAVDDYVSQEFSKAKPPTFYRVMEALWSLVGQGLVYLNFSESAPSNWRFQLTESGKAAARNQEINPDNQDEYLRRLNAKVPDASNTVISYTIEALRSYRNRCYLASAVMLGVASEAAFLEMAEAFAHWLRFDEGSTDEGTMFLDMLRNPRASYQQKFLEYRKKLESRKQLLPYDLADGIALTLDTILDLLRIYRNEAGHPQGKVFPRDQAKINLEVFVHYLERMYAFKAFFDRAAT
jgi:hypothetical protein